MHIIKRIREAIDFVKDFCTICAQVFTQMWQRPFYYRLLIQNMYDFGYKSLFIVTVLGVTLGFVLTLHIGISLEKYGAKLYVSKIISMAVFAELAIVLTPLILAGRIGAGMASEIGIMKITEQIDALRSLGISHIKRVVIPKVLACLFIVPILSLFLAVVTLLTAAYVAQAKLNLDPMFFMAKALYTPHLSLFLFGMLKTVFFALFIAITACRYGMNISKGSYEIGIATMKSVVVSSLLIICGDFVLTSIYYAFIRHG